MPPRKPKAPDEPQLVGVHNLSQENLKHADELGGLAAPSLAVVHHKHAFDNFGDVSLVASHDLVDPKKTPVFNADVYSPRHPRANYEVNGPALKAFRTWLAPYRKQVTDRDYDEIPDKVKSYGHADIHRDYDTSTALKLAWLREVKNHQPELKQKPAQLRFSWAAEKPLQDFIASHGANFNHSFGDDYHRGLSEAAKASIKAYADKIRPEDPELADGVEGENLRVHFNDGSDDPSERGLLNYGRTDHVIRDAQKAGTTEPDHASMRSAIEEGVERHGPEEFQRWADSKTAPLQGKAYLPTYTSTGNVRKSPYDMASVLKRMTRKIQGEEGFSYGPGSARALGAHRFRDVDDLRAGADKLVDDKTMEAEKEGINNRFADIASRLSPYHPDGNSFGHMDRVVNALGQSFRRGRSLRGELTADGFKNVPEHLLAELHAFGRDLVNAPTQYFEAKPQRAVGLNEFPGAAVPHDASPDTHAILARHGVKDIETYKRGDAEDRRRAVEAVARRNKLMLSEADVMEAFGKTERLAKMQTPPVFPGLGVPSVRSHTPIVQTDPEVDTKIVGGVAAANDNHPKLFGDLPRSAFDDASRVFPGKIPRGAVMGGTAPHVHSSFVQGNALTGRDADSKSDLATQQHEDFHHVMEEVQHRHGRGARSAITRHLVEDAVAPEHKASWKWFHDAVVKPMYGADNHNLNEESIALLHNYLNEPELRHKIKTRLDAAGADPGLARGVDNDLKAVHRSIRARASIINPDYLRTVLKLRRPDEIGKADDLSKMARGTGEDLGHATHDEYGVHFETGVPVEFNYLRHNTKTPNYGARFQQHIEPAGRYMVHQPPNTQIASDRHTSMETGKVAFKNPLVIAENTGGGQGYDDTSWKARLHRHFGVAGHHLSKRLARLGHDAIITVGQGREPHTSEIVDLTSFHHPMGKSEPLAKMALIHDDPKTPKTVYRIQDANGEGPYDSPDYGSATLKVPLPSRSNPDFYQPLPEDDFTPEDMEEFHGQGPEGHGAGHYQFGFEKPHHAERWFGKDGIKELYRNGYRLKAIPASKVYSSDGSGRQVFFEPHPSMPHPAEAPDAEDFDHPDDLEESEFHKSEPEAEVALILVTSGDGRILLGRRRDSLRWTMPGGHLDPGEPPEDGARRELKEETGCDAVSIAFLADIPPEDGRPRLHCYSATISGQPTNAHDPDQEIDGDWKWIDVRKGLPKNIHDNLHGPLNDSNVLRRIFDIKKNEAEVWLDAGFAALAKASYNHVWGDAPDPHVNFVFPNDSAGIIGWRGRQRPRAGFETVADPRNAPSKPGHVYRGISGAEHDDIVASGHIKSNQSACLRDGSEGTCFGDDFGTAESYTNLGSTNPARLGKPNYVIEVQHGPEIKVDHRDGYPKALQPIPASRITRAWRYRTRQTPEEGTWGAQGFQPTQKSEDLAKTDDDYRGEHQAPTRGPGSAPLHDLTGVYPEDFYSSNAHQLYSSGEHYDVETIHIIQSLRGRPNKPVRVYRAVPHQPGPAEQAARLDQQKAYHLKHGRPPADADRPPQGQRWYDWASGEADRLRAMPEPAKTKPSINPGDWVTVNKRYAVDHGKNALGGKYKIVSKVVPARHVYTDGNSLHEQGYDPSEDVGKSEDLAKGAMSRLHPFDPAGVDPATRGAVDSWQGPPDHRGSRNAVPQMEPAALARGIHKLLSVTPTKTINGERHVLLHRGMSANEQKQSVGAGTVEHNKPSSWTPTYGTAAHWHRQYNPNWYQNPEDPTSNQPVSAWVPVSAIRSIPRQYGDVRPPNSPPTYSKTGRGPNAYDGSEHEVVLNPHVSVLEPDPTPHVPRGYLGGRLATLNGRINWRPRVAGDGAAATREQMKEQYGKSEDTDSYVAYRFPSEDEAEDFKTGYKNRYEDDWNGIGVASSKCWPRDGKEGERVWVAVRSWDEQNQKKAAALAEDFGGAPGDAPDGIFDELRPDGVDKAEGFDSLMKMASRLPPEEVKRRWAHIQSLPRPLSPEHAGVVLQYVKDSIASDPSPYRRRDVDWNDVHQWLQTPDADLSELDNSLNPEKVLGRRRQLVARDRANAKDDAYHGQAIDVSDLTHGSREDLDTAARGKHVWMYHGTSSKLVPNILRQGLHPDVEHIDPKEIPGVYLTSQAGPGPATADFYARRAAGHFGGQPKVLRVRVPYDHLSPDEDDAEHAPTAARHQFTTGSVSPDEIYEVGDKRLPKIKKAELNPELTEVEALLRHPDPVERRLALKLSGVTRQDIGTALLDPDHSVYRAAFAHPDAPLETVASSPRDAAGNPIHDRHDDLLNDPRCQPHHVRAMYQATVDDTHLPSALRAARVAVIGTHPLYAHRDLNKSLAKNVGHDTIATAALKPRHHRGEPLPRRRRGRAAGERRSQGHP
jgi:8-oxo-dGTP pyrophosphatase MutT (NUDIX family)